MAMTGDDFLVETLLNWGVDTVFGIPGDGINGIMEALRSRKDKIKFVQVRHQEAAAFMACGYTKFTNRLGVCRATRGPGGGVRLLNGRYDAKMDGQPVLAITGHHFHDLSDTHTQQDINLDRVFMDAALYSTRVTGVEHVENVTGEAYRIALSRRGVPHINFPVGFQDLTSPRRSMRTIKGMMDTTAFGRRAALPAAEDMERAADVLTAGKKVAILAGRAALDATDELEKPADTIAAPIIKLLLGKACIPDGSPFTTGGIGLLETQLSQEPIENCDTLFMVGTSFPYLEFISPPPNTATNQSTTACLRPAPAVAAASPDLSGPPTCAKRSKFRFPRTAHRRSISIPAAPQRRHSATWSISTTMLGCSRSSSTGPSSQSTGISNLIDHDRRCGSNSNIGTLRGFEPGLMSKRGSKERQA